MQKQTRRFHFIKFDSSRRAKRLNLIKIMCIFVTFNLFSVIFYLGLLSNLTVKFETLLLIYT